MIETYTSVSNLFTRAEDDEAAEYDFKIILNTQREYAVGVGSHSDVLMYVKNPDDGSFEHMPFEGRSASGKIIEISIPRTRIEFDGEFNIRFAVEVHRTGQQVERWPSYDFIHTTMPTEGQIDLLECVEGAILISIIFQS